jgi:hypothetical protein
VSAAEIEVGAVAGRAGVATDAVAAGATTAVLVVGAGPAVSAAARPVGAGVAEALPVLTDQTAWALEVFAAGRVRLGRCCLTDAVGAEALGAVVIVVTGPAESGPIGLADRIDTDAAAALSVLKAALAVALAIGGGRAGADQGQQSARGTASEDAQKSTT